MNLSSAAPFSLNNIAENISETLLPCASIGKHMRFGADVEFGEVLDTVAVLHEDLRALL